MLTQHKPIAEQILSEAFNDLNDLGEVETFIPQSVHTADFELSKGFKIRFKIERNGVYYNEFRA